MSERTRVPFPVRLLSRLVGRQGEAHSSKNDEMREGVTHQGHAMYDRTWLSYRDFERIRLALGASGSDVKRLWPSADVSPLPASPFVPRRER